MDEARWARLKRAFDELVTLDGSQRARRLDAVATTDPGLATELRRLLAADDTVDERLRSVDFLGDAGSSEPLPFPPAVPAPGAEGDPFAFSGRTVSHFRVLEVLGGGGMGVVYRAEDVRLGRTVALKFLLPRYALDPSFRQRFIQEARAASALDHPNVCTVHEVGETADGQPFLAMACYRGATLRERIAAGGRLPIQEAVAIAAQVARGLEAAHGAGIVHRDLKPGNLMLPEGGVVKILDFGLAKVRDMQLTGPGDAPGTLAYMSPEQLGAGPVDGRTDLWALGVVLYEMLTGATPFGRGHTLSTLHAILHDDPTPLSRDRPDAPPWLEALVDGLLRKDPAERVSTAADVLAVLERTGAPAAPEPVAGRPPRTRRIAVAAVIATAALAGVAILALRPGDPARGPDGNAPATATAPPAASVAVLPFADLSADGDQAYFSDGVAEEILNTLARVPELHVPARTSSFQFRGRDLPAREVAARLGVAALLEGSVRRAGDRVRISTQLVDARSDRHLWSRTFDGSVEDVFGLQAAIARTVAEALKVRLVPGSDPGVAAPPATAAAHDLYLRGLFHWNRRTRADLGHAIRFLEEATRADPGYARAWAGLALAYTVLPLRGTEGAPPDEAFPLAERAARRAMELDPDLAEPHAALGYAYHWQWRWKEAARELARAIELNPAYATAHQWYGEHLAVTGRGDEGVAELRKAVALDPLSLVASNDLAIALLNARRYDEAVAQLERTRAMDPGFTIPLLILHRIHMVRGRSDEAAEAGRLWAELSGAANPDHLATLALATHDPALRSRARAILAEWERQPVPRWDEIAMYRALMGDHEGALDAIEQGVRVRTPMLASIRTAPWYDSLRGDPRFRAALARVGSP